MRRLDTVELAERLATTIDSIANDYEAGKLSAGKNVHPLKRLDDDWDPETGITNDNMMRLLAERLDMQGFVVMFDPAIVREKIIGANPKRPG